MTKTWPPRAYPPCPSCGRATRIRDDRLLTRHRIEADNPAAPWCPNSAPKENP